MKNILIVDDDVKVTMLLGRYLSSLGYQITPVNQSSKAIATAEALHPDLFILDIMMPHPDGFTLTSMLRNNVNFTKTPILIITALENSNSRATTLGANGYLAKPFNLDELGEKIAEMIGAP
ncbi:MAG: response regulator transcription factor [Anaerolineales bacterium]|nr:response regulator transcription factor [Anaerolineales bacterium]